MSSAATFTDADGTIRLQGTLTTAGGGAAAGAMLAADFLFTEVAAAGIYTAAMDVEAGTTVYQVAGWMLGSFMADSASLSIEDAAGLFFDPALQTSIGNDSGVYDPTSYSVGGTVYSSTSAGASLSHNSLPNSDAIGRYYAVADTITIEIDASASTSFGTTGRFLVRILYTTPVAAVAGTFTASP